MKRIYVSLIALALSAIAFAQSTDKIKLANSQKIEYDGAGE